MERDAEMTGIDLHPEELLDRVRRGQASAAERERVHEHLQSCDACRFEHALLAQSARDAAPHPGDGARARRIEQAATAALVARGVLAPSGPAAGEQSVVARPRRRWHARAVLAVAFVSTLTTAAAAAVITQPAWLERWAPALVTTPAAAPAAEAGERQRRPARAAERIAPDPAQAQIPAPPVELLPERQPELEPAPAQRSAEPRPGQARTAAELFASANAARREREPAAAVRLYRELARVYPRSDEAQVARVALGRLLLDRVGDARGALREFDAYLERPAQRALREDAVIGKALALGRLRRYAEERRAWKALLEQFPASAYAERARARLLELRCTREPC
jgi:hypothetical protein